MEGRPGPTFHFEVSESSRLLLQVVPVDNILCCPPWHRAKTRCETPVLAIFHAPYQRNATHVLRINTTHPEQLQIEATGQWCLLAACSKP